VTGGFVGRKEAGGYVGAGTGGSVGEGGLVGGRRVTGGFVGLKEAGGLVGAGGSVRAGSHSLKFTDVVVAFMLAVATMAIFKSPASTMHVKAPP